MTRRPFAVLAVVASLAGCADSGPSKKQYLAKVDPICKAATSEAIALTTPTDIAALRQFHIKLADGVDKTLAGIDAVTFPSGEDGKAAKAWVQAMRDAAAAARAVAPAVDKSDYGATETTARKAAEAFKGADSLARTFGSAECGRGEAEAAERMTIALVKTVKGAFVRAADALCKAAWTTYDALEPPETLPQVKTYFEKGNAIEEKLIADLRAIPAPLTDKDKLDEALAAFDAMLAKEKEVLAAAAAGNERATDDLWEQADKLSVTAMGKADAYGFVDCGSQVS
ncbi:MAG TPA: hypothetical protein VM938_06415 [Acidimicrobiales bacterium]|nr:hypothetical protein [Acidimicrobiales bacterium]